MRAHILFSLLASILILSCDKETEEFITEPISDYLPTATGKYITYRLDSTVFTSFGANTEIRSYHEKHQVDAQFTDNAGRTSYRVFRFIRDTNGTMPWKPSGTYFITPAGKTIEVTENNLRVLKLVAPLVQGKTWKGNQYLPYEPYKNLYEFTVDDGMNDWEFTYEKTAGIFNYKQQTLNNVVSVLQIDDGTKLDTVDAVNNKVFIPQNSTAVWIRGTATDTIVVNASMPSYGFEGLTIYNKTNQYTSLNKIKIPPGLSFSFQFLNNVWTYPNAINVSANKVIVPRTSSTIYIVGNATANIEVSTSLIDTANIKELTVYNRSNFNAFTNLNAQLNTFSIPPGSGRSYELVNNQWRLLGNRDALITTDPFSTDLPFGSKSYSMEKYAKGIGLVFQEFKLYEYQPPTSPRPGFKGFGVKRTIIDHN